MFAGVTAGDVEDGCMSVCPPAVKLLSCRLRGLGNVQLVAEAGPDQLGNSMKGDDFEHHGLHD